VDTGIGKVVEGKGVGSAGDAEQEGVPLGDGALDVREVVCGEVGLIDFEGTRDECGWALWLGWWLRCAGSMVSIRPRTMSRLVWALLLLLLPVLVLRLILRRSPP